MKTRSKHLHKATQNMPTCVPTCLCRGPCWQTTVRNMRCSPHMWFAKRNQSFHIREGGWGRHNVEEVDDDNDHRQRRRVMAA